MLVLLNDDFSINPGVKIEQAVNIDELNKQLFLNYFERLYAYAFTILKNNEDAKDVC